VEVSEMLRKLRQDVLLTLHILIYIELRYILDLMEVLRGDGGGGFDLWVDLKVYEMKNLGKK
jgi:hypothetical protein